MRVGTWTQRKIKYDTKQTPTDRQGRKEQAKSKDNRQYK
jgi:hypothetical protein